MVNKPANPFFKPQQQMLALEPRILFDGAAAVAAEHQNQDTQATPADARIMGRPRRRPSLANCWSSIPASSRPAS